MPPRKKARVPTSAASTPSSSHVQTPTLDTPVETDTPGHRDAPLSSFPSDPWTDEQEIALFKGVIRWKPAGMHKHFRIMAIAQQLQNLAPETYTRIPGIWKKLSSLYNLEAIDERENSFLDPDEEVDDPADEPYHAFCLPEHEYGEAMFDRRLAVDGSSSPPILEKTPTGAKRGRRKEQSIGGTRRASTVEDTEEDMRSSPPAERVARANRSKRASHATRRSRGKADSAEQEEATGEEADEEGDDGDENEEEDEEEGGGREDGTRSTRNTSRPGRGNRRQTKSQGGADTRRSTRKK